MSLMMLGANGGGGDLCTLRGLAELRQAARKKKLTLAFLNDGRIDNEELKHAVLAEIADNKTFEDMTDLLHECRAPVVLTDGVVYDDGKNTMNTRNALINALVNRCKDRAGKPEGAVENSGTSEGVKKGWEKRRQFYRGQGADNPRRPHSDAGGFAKREHLHVETEHGTFKSPSWWKGSKRHQRTAEHQVESVEHPSELVEKHGWKSFNCTARDVIADRKAANSTMLAQMSPSPMIGSYAEGKRRAKNSGTSEGVKKSWAHRHAGLTGPLLWHHVKDVHSEQDHKEMVDYAKKVGQHDPDIGVIPPGWKRVKNSGKSSDSVRWAREFLRKSRAQPGKPKVDSTKWAREALVALKAHKPVTNDHRADALEAGIQVELEHGPDRALAEKIARDHLREDPEYYTKLKRCGVK